MFSLPQNVIPQNTKRHLLNYNNSSGSSKLGISESRIQHSELSQSSVTEIIYSLVRQLVKTQ
jgi:hypothetical protein